MQVTGEAQRDVIAKACGVCAHDWSKPISDGQIGFIPQCQRCCLNADEGGANELCRLVDVPDYLNDRNATFAAAQQLGESVIKAMRFYLFTICGEMKAHHASADQESEAIVRALGKWIE